MSNNLWDDDNQSEEFRDVPDEVKLDSNKQPMQAPPAQVQNPPAYRPANVPAEPVRVNPAKQLQAGPTDEEFLDSVLSEEEDFTEVLADANLRIEQGRLYQMIMNHNLFEGMDADPRATQNVEREIRKFARERMEIMLGMRQEQSAQAAVVSSPFNDLEVDILKKIASKATNGATETAEANQVASVLREAPRKTLNPIGGSTALKRPSPVQKPQTKLPVKTQAPLQRKKVDATIEQIAAEEGVSVEDLELGYTGIGKPMAKLTEEELLQRARDTAQRMAKRTTVKSASALPMASIEQQEMLALQRATAMGQAPGMAALLEKVKSMPIKNP